MICKAPNCTPRVAPCTAFAAAQVLMGKGAAGDSFLTPIRLFVWLRGPQLRLRHLAAAAEQVAPLQGGPALGALCSLAQHGDPAVHAVSVR